MILVTAGGVREFRFDRLFRIIDELCGEGILRGEEIIAQRGYSTYQPKNYKTFDFIEADEFKRLVSGAAFIISHAGTGTVVPAVKAGKKIILFPRLKEYHEHLDNHQLEICSLFLKKRYALVARNKRELTDCISKIGSFTPEAFVSDNSRIVRLIMSCIEENREV
ncbi:glycosyltransferase family 28 C-terminal domain protein [Marvinbryantia formatexigens DSM 14469]|uniref:Glycosyltransferase family 28 C-terminal domain protein n=1 Tax=Marvinbryantia formatexigens DSM 14469 TaxID=478749 RepID=C6LCR9_9FIRM|nr:PssE/Cps14G family polysaccharide biosynthesis glycosyltransferase [Marvinbryantia formatexigens]EET61733.1 glycosyltransferase family 28 C-terminal domain protein [Marvinbryantia formatexigens DSM 14469]UWO24455.1 capsular biosynthesis protein CpsG [Marvinbryantia formatexigens DSM 14469]SDF08541.1 Glycosyltransferase family 28 C-terminal domain-containing protein [Marvinbryantia formatexigens]